MSLKNRKLQHGSPFLALPAELRNTIYALVLTPPYVPHLRRLATMGLCSDYILPSLDLSPALLQTCRQVHDEGTSILYGLNQFGSHPSLLTALPYLVSPRRPITEGPGRWKIRRWYIHVRVDVDPKFTAEQLDLAFSDAEELEIDVFQPSFGSCDVSVLELFEQIRGVGKATVTGSTGVDVEYAKWLEQLLMSSKGTPIRSFEETSGKDAVEKLAVWEMAIR